MSLIWQPEIHYQGFDFKISLDRDFAERMIQYHIPKKRQNRMNE